MENYQSMHCDCIDLIANPPKVGDKIGIVKPNGEKKFQLFEFPIIKIRNTRYGWFVYAQDNDKVLSWSLEYLDVNSSAVESYGYYYMFEVFILTEKTRNQAEDFILWLNRTR